MRTTLAPARIVERDGFPVFDVPSDAPIITSAAVAEAVEFFEDAIDRTGSAGRERLAR